ncbi:MAG: Crp/Fnr family transcriptional regulator [Flavobacteriaceae bacterium]
MHDCKKCPIKSFNLLNNLNHDELDEVSRSKTVIKVKKGEQLLEEGHAINGMFCISKGKCKMTKLNSNGKEQIVKFTKQGDVLGHRSILSEEPIGLSATALEDMEVCLIPKEQVLNAIKNNNRFSLQVMKNISHQLSEANNNLSNMAQKSVRERLADIFLQLEDIFGIDMDGNIDVQLTREEIANTIGTATESAIRLISSFKKEGLIEIKGKHIKILKRKDLEHLSEGY